MAALSRGTCSKLRTDPRSAGRRYAMSWPLAGSSVWRTCGIAPAARTGNRTALRTRSCSGSWPCGGGGTDWASGDRASARHRGLSHTSTGSPVTGSAVRPGGVAACGRDEAGEHPRRRVARRRSGPRCKALLGYRSRTGTRTAYHHPKVWTAFMHRAGECSMTTSRWLRRVPRQDRRHRHPPGQSTGRSSRGNGRTPPPDVRRQEWLRGTGTRRRR